MKTDNFLYFCPFCKKTKLDLVGGRSWKTKRCFSQEILFRCENEGCLKLFVHSSVDYEYLPSLAVVFSPKGEQ